MTAIHEGVWVRTTATPDGDYMCTVEVTDDAAFSLDATTAQEYATYVLWAAESADHDAAVLKQLQERLHLDLQRAGTLVCKLRDARPAVPAPCPLPLTITPGVSVFTSDPFLVLSLTDTGQRLGQWTVADARQHATHVLSGALSAQLDTAYRRHLVDDLGVSDVTAAKAVTGLSTYREGDPA